MFMKLSYEVAGVIFIKKNGDVRPMLCTRNLNTVELKYGFQGDSLGGHDNRCNINNGNIAVIDLFLGEARSFNVERVVAVEYYGEIKTADELDSIAAKFSEFRQKYTDGNNELSMDSI